MNKRRLIIGLPIALKGQRTFCSVWVRENDTTLHKNMRVRFGGAITNIMEEWNCNTLIYTQDAKDAFLGKRLDLTPST